MICLTRGFNIVEIFFSQTLNVQNTTQKSSYMFTFTATKQPQCFFPLLSGVSAGKFTYLKFNCDLKDKQVPAAVFPAVCAPFHSHSHHQTEKLAVNWEFISIFSHQRAELVRKTPTFQSPSGSNSNSALQENTISSPLLAPCGLIVRGVALFQHHKSLIIVANYAISTMEGNNSS